MTDKTTLKDALELNANYFQNNKHLIESKIITALAEDNAKLREALEMCVHLLDKFESPPCQNALKQRKETLTATDPEKRTLT